MSYIHHNSSAGGPTTNLQDQILHHICHSKNAEYKSIMKATGKSRITILQSLRLLTDRHLVHELRQDPEYEKSKRIFKPTDKGILFCILNEYDLEIIDKTENGSGILRDENSIMTEIEKFQPLPSIIHIYNKRITDSLRFGLPGPRLRMPDFITSLCQHDLFDDDGMCLLKDETHLMKYFIRKILLEKLSEKHCDIQNIFEGDIWISLAYEMSGVSGDVRQILIKIRKDLDEYIKLFSQ